jgi:secreted trypsin-like serine protease
MGNMSTQQSTPSVYDDRVFRINNDRFDPDDTRIIGGEPTSDFQECVAVGNDDYFGCTGTLVAPQVVVTAGHCAAAGISTRIFIGDDVTSEGPIIRVQEAITHPGYRPGGGADPYDDLTVLILTQAIEIEGVKPAPICSLPALMSATTVMLVGYGTTETGGVEGYGIRRKVRVGIASEDSGFGARYETEFVAGAMNLDRDSCTGDSGGPAYIEVDGHFQLAGATSRGTRSAGRTCGDGGVYTKVPAYRDWIVSVAGPLG